MSFLDRFRQAVASGALQDDAAQHAAAESLQALSDRLTAYRPSNLFRRVIPPRGLYLWGDVGRGKSMLMDMFFAGADARAKRRVHFNAFMAEVHELLHTERRRGTRDPIKPVAKRLAQDAALLCFDEFQVSDVADAMILGRLFEQLFARGSVVVATSNTAPDRLYEGGLNRPLFLPFIALMKERMDIVGLNGEQDYRRGLNGDGAYFTPLGAEADAAMDRAWRRLADGRDAEAHLMVLGRRLRVPHAANGAARFPFEALCVQPLAAADYLAVARAYHTILIDGIPVFSLAQRDAARRLTLLIDTLYDRGVRLICSAAAAPDALYPAGDGAFRRTASRLLEMQSDAYITRTNGQAGCSGT